LSRCCGPWFIRGWSWWLLIAVALLVKSRIRTVPGGLQNFFEPIIAGIEGMVEENMGPTAKLTFR